MRALCFGINNNGELGSETPIGISIGDSALEMENIVPIIFKPTIVTIYIYQISAGDNISCALFINGQAICFGYGNDGAIGNDSNLDVGVIGTMASLNYISFSDTIRMISISANEHVCGIFGNGKVRCWGSNNFQNLGDNTDVNKGFSPISPFSIKNAVYVSFKQSINTLNIIHVSVSR